LRFPEGDEVSTTESVFDRTGQDGSWIRGDHVLGRFSSHHMYTASSLMTTVLFARDQFDVTGVPPGTQVSVMLRFEVEGSSFTPGCGGSSCCAGLYARARSDSDSTETWLVGSTFQGQRNFSGFVEVPVVLTAGSPRELEVSLDSHRCPGGDGFTVDATGRVSFVGTDERARVVSCKGFGPAAVPVHRRSWGQLKTTYR
jgi:hypothetical protein